MFIFLQKDPAHTQAMLGVQNGQHFSRRRMRADGTTAGRCLHTAASTRQHCRAPFGGRLPFLVGTKNKNLNASGNFYFDLT
jgi:hypothetical protein